MLHVPTFLFFFVENATAAIAVHADAGNYTDYIDIYILIILAFGAGET